MTTTIPQHRIALQQANQTRYFIADCRRALREAPNVQEGRNRLASLIEENPHELRNAVVYSLTNACRKTGPFATRRFLREAGVSEFCTVGQLTERQRGALGAVLRG